MDEDIDHILQLIATARSAWDQYNIQLALPPAGTAWFTQAHPWDSFNNGHLAPQVRRNPAAIGAAWNRLQDALVELSDASQRVRGRAGLPTVTLPVMAPDDRRVGSFSRAVPAQVSTPNALPHAFAAPDEKRAMAVPETESQKPALVG